MNRELDKLVQQYADLYPYDPQVRVSTIPLQQPANQPILNAPSSLPPAQSIQIPVEQRPPVLNPVAKDLQILPNYQSRRATVEVVTEPPKRSLISDLMCGENMVRLILIAILVVCLYLYFRKK